MFIVVSIYQEQVLIHIRHYLNREIEDALIKFFPTKGGITLTPKDLMDLHDRVIPKLKLN